LMDTNTKLFCNDANHEMCHRRRQSALRPRLCSFEQREAGWTAVLHYELCTANYESKNYKSMNYELCAEFFAYNVKNYSRMKRIILIFKNRLFFSWNSENKLFVSWELGK
jgi:hypothetical protein